MPGPAPVTLPTLTGWKFSYRDTRRRSRASTTAPGRWPTTRSSERQLAVHPGAVRLGLRLRARVHLVPRALHGHRQRDRRHADGGRHLADRRLLGLAERRVPRLGHRGGRAARPTFSFPAGARAAPARTTSSRCWWRTPATPRARPARRPACTAPRLNGSSAPITWRLMGSPGGSTLQDPVRGVMNAAGLFGTDNGWDLPGYPDQGWQPVTLPDSWAARGVPPGIGWYRTSSRSACRAAATCPIDVQIGGPGPGAGTADYRAFIYVNGWLIGRYVNNVGPQHQFYVPAGILNDRAQHAGHRGLGPGRRPAAGWTRCSLVAAGEPGRRGPGPPGASAPATRRGVRPTVEPAADAGRDPVLGAGRGHVHGQGDAAQPGAAPLRNASMSLNAPRRVDGGAVRPGLPGHGGRGAAASATLQGDRAVLRAEPGPDRPAGHGHVQHGRPGARGTQTLINSAQVNVPAPSLAATFDNTGVTDDTNTSPSASFEGFDGEGTTYSAQGLAADSLTPGASVTAGGLDLHLAQRAVRPARQHDGRRARRSRMSGSGATAGLPGRGQQLGRVGHRHDLLHRRQHPAVHPERGQLLVPVRPGRQPVQHPGRRR